MRTPGSMKDAQRLLLDAVGGINGAVQILFPHVGRSQLARYTSENEDDAPTNMPLHIIDKLEDVSSVPIVTRWLAHRRHHLLIPMPKAGNPEPYLANLCKIGEETALLFSKAHAALADGTLTAAEAAQIRRQCMQVIIAIETLLGGIDAALESGRAD